MLKISATNTELPVAVAANHPIQPLDNGHKAEVLSFLSARPLHTFIKTSWIYDHGLISHFNRGTFYGCRDSMGRLEGVALIGHITLFEARTDSAIAAFAELIQSCPSAHAVLGEEDKISQFMTHYEKGGMPPRLVCRELLLEKRTPESLDNVPSLRLARPDELELVVSAHALSAFEESGVNPLDVDPSGFRDRCARRIDRGRVWLAIEDGRLKFKADVVSDTSDVIYVEGVYVSAEHRGNGYGARCVTQLTNHLLERTGTVCLLVNQKNVAAQFSYRKAGYKFREYYDTLYLQHRPLAADPEFVA
jgi:ribosomal protein S18 acetylase RimI-like enzyme